MGSRPTGVGSEGFGQDGECERQRKISRRETRGPVGEAKTEEQSDNAVDERGDALAVRNRIGGAVPLPPLGRRLHSLCRREREHARMHGNLRLDSK